MVMIETLADLNILEPISERSQESSISEEQKDNNLLVDLFQNDTMIQAKIRPFDEFRDFKIA